MENELPKRKGMRLARYDYSAGGAYFITVCVQNRRRILSEVLPPSVGDGAPDVPHLRLTKAGETVKKHLLSSERISGVTVDQYVIMPDHIHAIILLDPRKYENTQNGTSRAPSPTNKMLPRVIAAFKRFCHLEMGEVIFQRSYSEHIVRDAEDYETRKKYIYENPNRWYYREIQK